MQSPEELLPDEGDVASEGYFSGGDQMRDGTLEEDSLAELGGGGTLGASTNSKPSTASGTMSTLDLTKLFQNSQAKIGQMLLVEQEAALERWTKRIES